MVIKAFVQQLKYLSFHNYHLTDLAEKAKSVQQEITTKTCQSIAVLHYQFSLVCPAPRLHHKSSHHKNCSSAMQPLLLLLLLLLAPAAVPQFQSTIK